MNAKKKKKIQEFSIAFFLITIGLYFILYAFSDKIVFFYTPSELHKANLDKEIKIGGLVQKDSIKKIAENSYQFILTDNNASIIINYEGLLPSLFHENQGVVAKGKLFHNKTILLANQLLIKHDEKYKPPYQKPL